MKKIKQKHYGLIEIDTTEKDVVTIWNSQCYNKEIVQIEREHLPKLIEILQAECTEVV